MQINDLRVRSHIDRSITSLLIREAFVRNILRDYKRVECFTSLGSIQTWTLSIVAIEPSVSDVGRSLASPVLVEYLKTATFIRS